MYRIQFDGASRGNPGPMGIGVALFANGRLVDRISERLKPEGTNNVAEYTALLRGIQRAKELGWTKINIEGDSQLIIKQVKGVFRVRQAHLRCLIDR